MAPDTQQRWLHDERVKLLASMAPIAHVVTILNAGLVTLMHWRVVAPWVLLTWLTCILTITDLPVLAVATRLSALECLVHHGSRAVRYRLGLGGDRHVPA